jgi:hypothetical protein
MLLSLSEAFLLGSRLQRCATIGQIPWPAE